MYEVSRELGRILVEREVLTEEELSRHTADAEAAGTPLASVLVSGIPNGRETVLKIAAERLSIPYYDPLQAGRPTADALRAMGRELAEKYLALPVALGSTQMKVAMADPFDRAVLKHLHKVTGYKIAPMLGPRDTIKEAIGSAFDALEDGPEIPSSNGDRVGVTETTLHVNELLVHVVEMRGSDLHLTTGTVPQIRVNGRLVPLEDSPRLTPQLLQTMIYAILTGDQREKLENDLELDFSHPVHGMGRYRVNVFHQRGSLGAVLRAIPDEVPSLEDLRMPSTVRQFASLSRGLVLVTGATGSGKSTTLASLLDLINETRPLHVMTIEDPIEFLHRHKRAIVNQRELGADTRSFATALRQALRQDPDVILVGELRDLETMETALTAAETGHVVFATLHTQSAAHSVERMIDVFPSHQQQQVRVQLAGSLQGVVTQQLLPMLDGSGRIAAVEVLVATAGVRNLIREGKQHQITTAMQAGSKHGMQTMDQALAALVKAGQITMNDAIERAQDVEELKSLAGRH